MADKSLELFQTKLPEGEISDCINVIMGTLAFRKLSEKTQVILSLSGPDVRTRLTHTIEVAKIARDICVDLGLNAELAEAIALAHDIGHTPFGHVGERTLREIMCGCDTLEGKVEDFDFNNTGFKHNLQSFRVLHTLEALPNGGAAWPYILWGAVDHTKMSYSKPYSGMDNETYISCQHCDWVYRCYFHDKKECKRNVLNRQKGDPSKRICKPWYCAKLETVKTKKDCVEFEEEYQEKNGVKPRHLWNDLIENKYFKIKHLDDVFCNEPCYMARLWEHKFENENLVDKYRFLFDHPFPNSFYSKKMHEYFFAKNISNHGWISVEAQIVKQADEIAQRQEDLEDGITKGLIPLKNAQEKLNELVSGIKFSFEKKRMIRNVIKEANNPEKIGSLIVEFYSKLLKESTIYNFNKFVKGKGKDNINIYCMMHIILNMGNDKEEINRWILQETTNMSTPEVEVGSLSPSILSRYFDIDTCGNNLLFIAYDQIDSALKTKGSTDEVENRIIDKLINNMELGENDVVKEYRATIETGEIFAISFNRFKLMETISKHLKDSFPSLFNDFFKAEKKDWKWKFEQLNLKQFYALEKVYGVHATQGRNLTCVADLINLLNTAEFTFSQYTSDENLQCFSSWRNINKKESNQVLSKIVSFTKQNHTHMKNKEALDNFNNETGKIILKSEIVEKHDGKATYILKRLFKAYIDNPHQLPDHGLKSVLFSFKDKCDEYSNSEQLTFATILNKLRKTLPYGYDESVTIIDDLININYLELTADGFKEIKRDKSNEMKSLLTSKEKLYKFIRVYIASDEYLSPSHRDEFVKESIVLSHVFKEFRRVMDNPILTATPLWNSILTRGICDYIASLTDQEAIDEYEKLYAGIMEII